MHDRDAILAAVDLAALADELLGSRRGTARSPTWPCPNAQHAQTGRTPPVTVFRSQQGHERWHCHGCGAGGTAIDLVLATAPLAERVKAVEIDREYRKKQAGLVASDHAPVWADLA